MNMSSEILIPITVLRCEHLEIYVSLNNHIVLNILLKSLLKNKINYKASKMYYYYIFCL